MPGGLLRDASFTKLVDFLGTQTGLWQLVRDPLALQRALLRTQEEFSLPDCHTLLTAVRRQRPVMERLIDHLSIRETFFFRHTAQFETLRTQILPALSKRPDFRGLVRVWSAGCASGEEAYSLAMMLHEAGWQGKVRILGTDISATALEQAKLGWYREWSFRGCDENRQTSCFVPDGSGWKLKAAYREGVEFDYFNLASGDYEKLCRRHGAFDLILCRNVFLYFDAETVDYVGKQLASCLRETGVLLTSSTDPALGHLPQLRFDPLPGGGFYRPVMHGDQARMPVGSARTGLAAEGRPGAGLKSPAALNRGFTASRCAFAVESAESTPEVGGGGSIKPARDSSASASEEVKPEARENAFDAARAGGDYARALSLLESFPASAPHSLLKVQLVAAAFSGVEALQVVDQELSHYPQDSPLLFIRAVLLAEQGQAAAAVDTLEQVLYLDRSLAFAQYTLGLLLRQQGLHKPARRVLERALRLAQGVPAQALVPLSEGGTAGELADAACQALADLGAGEKA